MAFGTEIQRLAVGMQEGRTFAIGCIDLVAEIHGRQPLRPALDRDPDIAVAAFAAVELASFRNNFSDSSRSIRNEEERLAVGGHEGIGIPHIAVDREGQVLHRRPALVGFFEVIIVAVAEMSGKAAVEINLRAVEGDAVQGFMILGVDLVAQILRGLPGAVLVFRDVDVEVTDPAFAVAGEIQARAVGGDGWFDLVETRVHRGAEILYLHRRVSRGAEYADNRVETFLHGREFRFQPLVERDCAGPILFIDERFGCPLQGEKRIFRWRPFFGVGGKFRGIVHFGQIARERAARDQQCDRNERRNGNQGPRC